MPSVHESSRQAQTLAAARDLVDSLENGTTPIATCLMKGQRLARLLRDTDAQGWLDREIAGYPEHFDLMTLGTAARYALRYGKDGTTFTPSLPALEANVAGALAVLNKLESISISAPVANFVVARATKDVIAQANKDLLNAQSIHVSVVATFTRMKAQIYRWAADTLVTLEFGSAAETIFETARAKTDEFIRLVAPKAAEQLMAAEERIADGTAEGLSAATTSCRRALATVADALFPPREEAYVDGEGKKRKAGADFYVNRLLAYVEQRETSQGTSAVVKAEVSHISARLDSVYAKACKGVHDDVTLAEARLVLIHTYLLFAEVARLGVPTHAGQT